MPPQHRFRISLTALIVALLLSSCAVGPEFHKPAAPEVNSYASSPISATTGMNGVAAGESQHLVSGHDIPGEWWKLFHDRALDDLIERSLKNNPSLKSAAAAVKVAHENSLAQKGAYYPSVNGSFNAARQKTSGEISPVPNSGATYFSLYTPQVSVSYVPDVFGLNRRTVESLNAQAEQARFALIAAHITLSANVASAAVQEASLRAQIAATHQLIDNSTDVLKILRQQFARGVINRADVAAQESQLAQVNATLPPLEKQLAQQRDLLAMLSGGFPGQKMVEEFELADFHLPQELPLSLPSQLVEQRPDIRQAEENMHAASAQIGIAVANRLPNINLTADVGTMALQASEIFGSGAGFWTLAGTVSQPIFQGGMLLHKERAARAAYVQAAEQYRSVVQTAFQNVADSLHALDQDARALKATAAARDAARVSMDLARLEFQKGSANYVVLLNAEQAYQQALISFVQAQANRYADTVALFQALGGGWWNRVDLARSDASRVTAR